MRLPSALLALLAFAPHAAAGSPAFVEETAVAGVVHSYDGEWEYMVGGGASSFDCDADGFPDLFLAGGSSKAALFRNVSEQAGPLRFEQIEAGVELEGVTGAYPLDIDSDGTSDLVILRSGENVVMRGKGGCRFERANELWGFDGGDAWSTAFSAIWEKGSGWPTIAIGNYIDRHEEFEPWGSCTDNWLHRPAPGKTAFAPPLPLAPSYCPLSILFTDWNRSGTPSLRVSNDREYYVGGQEQMWRVEPGSPPSLYTEAEGWKYLRIWGMGIASRDLDGDGLPEYFLTSMADHKLQKAQAGGGPSYADIAFARGVTAHRPYTGGDVRPSTGWHAQFEDVDNDGLADLFVAKGNVDSMPDFAAADPNNLLVQQPDGSFAEMGESAGVASMQTSRGATLADFNLDGLVDLVVVNRRANAQIWRNATSPDGGWLQVRLEQDGANHDAIGAWIEVKAGGKTMLREVTSGGGHASGHLGWKHFGLADAASAEIRVQWPGGEWSPAYSLEPGKFAVLRRGGNAPVEWQPADAKRELDKQR